MSRFALQCISGVILFLFMMLIGIWIANHGLKSMKGYRQPTYEQIAHMTGTKNSNVEMEILGETFSAHEKQKTLENLRSFNVVEAAGRGITEFTRNVAKFGTDIVIGKIKEIFIQLEG